jgi:hypothetical protein
MVRLGVTPGGAPNKPTSLFSNPNKSLFDLSSLIFLALNLPSGISMRIRFIYIIKVRIIYRIMKYRDYIYMKLKSPPYELQQTQVHQEICTWFMS